MGLEDIYLVVPMHISTRAEVQELIVLNVMVSMGLSSIFGIFGPGGVCQDTSFRSGNVVGPINVELNPPVVDVNVTFPKLKGINILTGVKPVNVGTFRTCWPFTYGLVST
jgi:hypothetical protein